MCDGQRCLTVQWQALPGGSGRLVILGGVPRVERFSTALLTKDSPWLRYDGHYIEILASDRTLTYEVTELAPDRPPSDDDFVTARLVDDQIGD